MTPRLHLEGLTKRFGRRTVLDGLTLSVGAGESLVIIGASGSGKSVTLKLILGLLPLDGGRILLDGGDLAAASARARLLPRFGMLFQGGALFDSLPVWENVSFALLQRRQIRSRPAARDHAVETLALVGLGPATADLYPAELSGGMLKRVALARAIAPKPEILFFDEPTTGLDPINAAIINRLIRERVTALGATAVTITHDMASVRAIADRVAWLHQGRIGWQGPIAAMDRSGDARVTQFIEGLAEGPLTAA